MRGLGALRHRRQQPVRQHRDRLRRDLREPASSPAPTPATGSASRSPSPAAAGRSSLNGRNGVLDRPALVEGRGPVELQQSGHDPAGRRRRFRPDCRSCALSTNVNHLWFDEHRGAAGAAPARARSRSDIGWDYSVAAIWRPKMTQNIVFRASARGASIRARASAICSPTANGDSRYYSVLLNAILTF